MKSKSIFQIITAVFLCIPLIVVCQLPDIRLTEKPGKAIMNLPDGKSLLYEQSSVPSNEGAVSSQEFPDYPSYSTQATDDFFVPEGQTWVIEEISVLGQYSSGGGPSQMANLFILQNNPVGNEPGEPFTEYMDFPVISTPEGNLHFDLLNAPGFGPLVLNPGHYWISIQPDMAYEPYGQWYWNKQESPTLNQEFYWRNPGGGFGIGCIDWTAASLVPWGQPVEDLNLSFSLFGNYTSVILCPIVFAGNDATIMAGNSYFTGDAYAMNFSELMWNSTGNGTFSDPLVLNSWYDPWLGDLLNPSVLELCLTALPIPPCMEIVTDCMTLTIIPGPIVVGSVADMYGNPVPEDAIYIEANPWCFPSDILSTENGGIIYRIENGQGFYEFNYTMFENPPAPGDDISIFVVNMFQAPLQDFALETVSVGTMPQINYNITVSMTRNLHFPAASCTWYEVCIPPGKTAKFDYSDVDFCGNTSVQRWNGTSWEDYRHWNWNGNPPNNHREIDNVGTGVGKVRLHNDNYDQDGFQVTVSIDPPTKQTSPDNREEFATVSLGGRDSRSCEFGNIVAPTHVFAFEQGALYSDFPGTLGEGGVGSLEIQFESYDNSYWNDMQLMLSCVNIDEPAILQLTIPDAEVPVTTVTLLPGDEVVHFYPGGIPSTGNHTMNLTVQGSLTATIALDAFNFTTNIDELQVVMGTISDMYGYPVPEDAIYIEANPWCFPSDILSTENGGIIYRIENGQGFYEFNYTMFENPPAPGDDISIFVVNMLQAPLQDFALETVSVGTMPQINYNITVSMTRNLHFPAASCTWYEVCIPPGKTAKFDYSDVDFCGNTSVQRWNGTSWEDYRHWNWNGSPPNNHREIDNVGTGVGKVRLHNDNYDQDGFQVSVSIDPPTKQTSPDNREEFATVSLGGRDGRSCEFGNIVATTHVFAFEQGALYSDFPGTLGEGGVDNLEIEFESYDNPYWSDMQLMISCVSVSEPLTLSLAIPDADVPLTTADILPGETVCYLNPGGINAPGYHTMTISLATSGKQPATLTIDAFNFSSLVWTMFYHLDYGDAPDSYLTLGSSNGARHGGDGLLRLGNLIDFELDGQPSPGADGDDLNNEPDEDGVLFLNPIVAGENMNLKVFASAQGYLSSWIDLTGNGTFTDAGEKIFSNILLTPGWNTLSANITPNARVGITYIRFRFCSTAGLNFFGLAADGEVEDYRVNIYPAGWGYIPSPVTHLILIPLNVGLNANLLNPDDILGVFYTDEAGNLKCGGASAWDGTTNQVLIANGDDITTIGKTGFAEDEELQWRLFKVATGTAQWIDVTYDPAFPDSDGKFSSTGLSALASLGNFYDLQIFSGWSGLSTYFIPSNTDIVSMMNPIVNDLIILYNITGVYWPSQNINTLITWNIYKGHVIKVSDDVILTLAGQDITNKTVSLVSGWNLIPVFSQSSSTSLLGGLPGFVVAKGVATNEVYWPAYNINTMPYLNVGKAYYVYTTQAGSITYAKGGEEILWESPEMIASTPWNDIAWSPNAHLVAFTAESLKSLQNGDMLAAFTPAGRCAGAAVISDVADPAVLIINGDDPTTPTLDGFQTDDQLNFRVYREQTNETFELEVIWDKNLNHSGLFETNGLSSVVIMKTAGLRKTEAALFDFTINPNPSKGIFNIKGSQQIDEITISNLFGETILSKQMSTNEPVDLRDYPDGIYFIRISSYGKVFFSKLVKTNL